MGIDLDGVLFSWSRSFSKVVHDLYPAHEIIMDEREQIVGREWSEWAAPKEIITKAWNTLHNMENMWETLETLNPDQVKYMIEKFNKANLNIYFITARIGSPGRPLLKQCINALKAQGWDDPQVIISFKKGIVAKALELDYFLDDFAENCVEVIMERPQTEVYLLDKKYNRILQDKYFHINRISRLEEFVDKVIK